MKMVETTVKHILFILSLLLGINADAVSQNQGRFVAAKRDKTYLRLGPDRKFPIEWVYLKDHYPFKIIAEFDDWYKVRDPEGIEGWVFKKSVSSDRWICVMTNMAALKDSPKDDSKVLAYLKEGVLAHLDKCQKKWCRIQVKSPDKSFKGWVRASDLWGLYDEEMK